MDIDSLGWILVIVAGIASAIVRNLNPKENGFWHKVLNILNYISVFNPRGTIVIPYDDYLEIKKRQYKKDKENVEPLEYRE